MREKNPHLPTFEETNDMGIVDRKLANSADYIALKPFRDSPETAPLPTPSGKIEIYSERLAKIAKEWEYPTDQRIPAVPEYCVNAEGVENKQAKQKYPLQMTGYHDKGHAHSSYFNIAMLREAVPHQYWINPIDASARGIQDGDITEIFNDRGRMHIKAKVTERVLPGVIAVPQGAWREVNEEGVDIGGCINTLTTQQPSALVKGNPQHTNLVDVKRA